MVAKPARDNPKDKWNAVGALLRVAVASTRVTNAGAPINVILVGPPGDGKTEMIRRVSHCPVVGELSDATYLGIANFVSSVRTGNRSCLVIPDLASVAGRRFEVARSAVSMMAMMCAEGVKEVAIGKRVVNYRGAKAGIIGAISYDDLLMDLRLWHQNAFLSRVVMVEFEWSTEERREMRGMKRDGDRSLLTALPFPKEMVPRAIKLPPKHAKVAEGWWYEMQEHRADRTFGFRTAEQMDTLLLACAYLRGGNVVAQEDVTAASKLRHLWLSQFKINPDGRR